jgi:hypothetical protein
MEDIVAIVGFFGTVIVLAIGVPLVRAYIRRSEQRSLLPSGDPHIGDRLARIEQAVDAMAIEVERIAEGQRFVTRLMAERPERAGLPSPPNDTR